ncbi:MAG: AbrB family transcriptional regulator [Fusobacterium varium]|jgi:virulence-associated protein VagC|uniref:AbrB family transcriptional regulator n=1 Tax=Fusobacterium varium ATCC 27725 TaxID=469618 RepID=A0ABN5JHQ1_FUSVA|nr:MULTISPECIES: hypothetical protein [Fusobacterium]AVQ31747.1 AbrB family transcriptional regulator [Fusobacterium varium ATCC 27725]EES63092.1 toxin-antitoxin system, antitoxin component, AbrB family [Fusobacterium varium ATCC 27725]MCB8563893.1 AbrB family transcriptional regulator [Fusobacterium ulcerans]MCB8648266.1 AbrB family transcriptional regulator [Fusobacterium ulcerans]MEE0137169.1 AbrB family transcriptional regulator [Fusobacterium ulcerans]
MSTNILEMNKTISISSKNQITIPNKLMEFLGFGKEAKIRTDGNSLIITPLREDNFNFSDLLLEDLIMEGYEGEELLKEFRLRTAKIKPALKEIIKEAETNTVTTKDIFGDDF